MSDPVTSPLGNKSSESAKVNEVNMAKWIVALRSGGYKQGTLRLRRGEHFCCLGVACDVSGVGTWKEEGPSRLYDQSYGVDDGHRERNQLPPEVVDWLFPKGSTADDLANPALGLFAGEEMYCTRANDVGRWTFAEIAAALESQYLPGKKAEEILADDGCPAPDTEAPTDG